VRVRFTFPRWSSTPVECFGVVADWRGDSLTAWANFQGPFTLHSVAAAALGLKGSKLRLITPPDSGGSFGIKSSVFAYVVLVGLASKKLGVPVRWTEDRFEHLAASSHATGRVTELEAAFASDGETAGSPASIRSTPASASATAIFTFSSARNSTPACCSPSRSVTSCTATRSGGVWPAVTSA